MALIIDTGTFLVGNSLVTVAEADAFHSIRQNQAWELAALYVKEAALIKAFDFLSVQNWKSDAFESGVPLKIKNAQCIGALRELDSPGALQPDVTPGIKKEAIDGVNETEYFENSGSGVIHTAVENLIKPYMKVSGLRMRMRIVRGGG